MQLTKLSGFYAILKFRSSSLAGISHFAVGGANLLATESTGPVLLLLLYTDKCNTGGHEVADEARKLRERRCKVVGALRAVLTLPFHLATHLQLGVI